MTAHGANVKLVPDSVDYDETLEDYIIQAEYSLPSLKRAAQTPALGDAFPDDADGAPWGYIITEQHWGLSSRRPAQGARILAVRYAKVKTPFTSGITGLREAYRKFETGRRGRRMGTRIFYAADTDAGGLIESALPEGLAMAEGGQWAGALLRETILEQRWRVGLAKITAVYDTYAEHGELEPTGRGILEADVSAVRMWNNFTIPGTDYVANVPFKDSASKTRRRWTIIEGANAWPYVRAQLRIKVVLTTSQLNMLAPLVGRVNNKVCKHIINAPKHTLWFNDLALRQRKRAEGRRYDTIIYLMYEPAGWDAAAIAELQEYRVDQTKVYEDDGKTDTGTWQRMGVWVPVPNTATKKLLGAALASFAAIDRYLG
ncbi:MAG TPA: hypothetical protein VMY35_13505 [Phycisphaerae bacterium]|nr:hypothetical protein [Phycisphaerae bacterium]